MTRPGRARGEGRPQGSWRRSLPALLPPLLAVLLVIPTFALGYLFDDYDFLGRSQTFRPSHLLPDSGALFYRPVSREVYFGALYLLDPNRPFWGHLGNALLLALAVGLLASLTAKLAGARAGFFAGIAYASLGCLPVLVGWVSGAQDLLAIVFVLLSLRFQLARRSVPALVAAALALLSKETAVALLPAIVLLPALAGAKPGRTSADLWRFGALAGAWAAIHPGMRQLLANRLESGATPTSYLTLSGADALASIGKSLVSLVNLPVGGPETPWPEELNLLFAAGAAATLVGVVALAPVAAARTARRDSGGSPGRPSVAKLSALAALLTLPAVVVSSLLVRQWELYYVGLAGFGVAMLLGVALARIPAAAAAAGAILFLAMGVWCRGMSLGSSIPTERNMRAPSERLDRVKSDIQKVLPTLDSPVHVYLAVDTPEERDVSVHLFRFQALRVWYRNHAIDTMHPEWRRADPPAEHLVWIAPDLTAHEIDPRTLAVRSSGGAVNPDERNRTLRAYAQGLAASGMTDRAVSILLGLEEPDEYAAASDRRLAGALLLADGRRGEAEELLRGTPSFTPEDALAAACEILANPSRRDIDDPVLIAMGVPPADPEAVRRMMRWFALNRSMGATIRFAERLLALRPGDPEASAVLRLLRAGMAEQRATVPVAPDSLW